MTCTIGSLFSGIGGLELGLEQAGLGRVVWQVEKDPYCRAVLAKHWPSARRYDDVQTVGKADLVPVDLICGGFPCQDVSSAGKQAGLAGERSGLWFEFRRIVEELAPPLVIVENISHGRRAWLPTVRRQLCELGYRTRAIGLSAAAVGAPHLRRRVFVVAHTDGQPLRILAERRSEGRTRAVQGEGEGVALDHGSTRGWQPLPDIRRSDDGVPAELDSARISALGNAVVPQCAAVIGRYVIDLLSKP